MTDEERNGIVYGQKVSYRITGGGYPDQDGHGYVIGWLAHAPHVAVIADQNYTGMSISTGWLTRTGIDVPIADRFRKRYLKAHPDALAPR